MNVPAVGHTCACLLRLRAAEVGLRTMRSAAACRPGIIQMAIPTTARRRNMSLWFTAKKKVQRAWSYQVKSETLPILQKFGVEIGTAHVLARLGARIQFTNGHWYTNEDIKRGSLPVNELTGQSVVAVDAKETDVDQFSMVDVVKLSQLKFLSLEGCQLVDDHCLASLVNIRDSLTHLNVNRCSGITENGIATLHKLRNLERLNMNDTPKVNHGPLVAVMLEDVLPRLRISLVSRQVERFVDDARRSRDIIQEHRRNAGLAEEETNAPRGEERRVGKESEMDLKGDCEDGAIPKETLCNKR